MDEKGKMEVGVGRELIVGKEGSGWEMLIWAVREITLTQQRFLSADFGCDLKACSVLPVFVGRDFAVLE